MRKLIKNMEFYRNKFIRTKTNNVSDLEGSPFDLLKPEVGEHHCINKVEPAIT